MKPTNALNSNFIGITTLNVSGSLSAHHQEFLAVRRLWCNLCSCDDRLLPGAGWNWMYSVASGIDRSAPGSKRSSNLQKCTNADVRLRTPDDGQKGYPKYIES